MFSIKEKTTPWVDSPVLTVDGVDRQLMKVDCAGQDYELNAYGFPLSDIVALKQVSTLQEYELVAKRMESYIAENPDNSKLTVGQIMERVSPWSMQTPSEIDSVAQSYGFKISDKVSDMLAARQARMAAAVAQRAKAAEPTSVPDVNV